MTPPPDDPLDPRPPDPSGRAAPRERWFGIALVVAMVLGIAAFVASEALRGDDATRTDEPVDVGPGGPDPRLRAAERGPRPVPPDAVDVVVVTRDRGEPVEGVGVRRRTALVGVDEATDDAEITPTDAQGRVRLRGTWPAFLDLASAAWEATPALVPTEGGREVRFEVAPRRAFRASLLDATTALPMAAWLLAPAERGAGDAPRTDGRGVVAWSGLARPPSVLAAGDGHRRVHAFLLYALPGRAEVSLAVPPVARGSRLRVVDVERRPVAHARAYVLAVDAGVFVETDDGGETDLEYGARDPVPLVVVAPGRVRRRVEADGRAELLVVLEAAAPRTFHVRRPDGTDVPDGTRVIGWTIGPTSYGPDGPGIPFAATTAGGLARVEDLPATAFVARLVVVGPGVLATTTVDAGAEPATAIDVRAGAPRPVALRVALADGTPATSILVLHAPRPAGCATRPAAARAAVEEAMRAGRADVAFAAIALRTGPDVTLDVPSAETPLGVDVLTLDGGSGGPGDGAFGCVDVPPGDVPAPLEIRLAARAAGGADPATVVLVEWDDGVPAALVDVEITRDESGAVATHAMTDSSGAALVAERTGRFVVSATRPDGRRYVADGPLLLPAPGVPLLRLRPAR